MVEMQPAATAASFTTHVLKDGDSFVLTWRDHPQVPKITRPRLSLALLHPNP